MIDEVAGLALRVSIELDHVLRVQATVTNTGGRRYSLDALTVTLPIRKEAAELLMFEGRWSRALHPARRPWEGGS
ncbi:MAG: glycoside hydrolase family 36 N-terminal domain-containing protein, partial [Ilumatobacteraceae bacterium]